MFGRLGRFVVHNPWKVIVAWVLAAFAIVAFAPTLSDVTSQEQGSFLPNSYESIKAQELAKKAFALTNDSTATIVVKRSDGAPLTDSDQAKVGELGQRIKSANIDRVTNVTTGPQVLSPNKKVQLVSIGVKGLPDDQKTLDAVKRIRETAKPALSAPLALAVTGDVAMQLDNQDAFNNALAIIGIATVVLIITLLLLIYRSPIAALLPIVTVGIVTAISPGLIALVAKATNLHADPSLQIILTIVLFGVGTDYILFLLFRYRERLRAGEAPKEALANAVARVGEVIASAAGAIIIAFCALLLAIFGAFKSLGPGLAIAVAVMALAAVTLIPAVVSLVGPKVFWPSKSWQRVPKGTTFQRLGRFTGRRPGVVALVSGGLMVVLALSALAMKTDFDQTGQLPSNTESSQGFKDLQAGFPAGALNPTTVYLSATGGQKLDPAAVEQYATALKAVPGVGGIMPAGTNGALAAISQDGTAAEIDLSLSDSPYSNGALKVAGDTLRVAAHAKAPPGTTALVGGVSSTFADINSANSRDLKVIFPVAGLLIALILALMLRSVVAPLYLMISVVLGFFSTLGATVVAFQGVLGRPGLSFQLPIILYLFVVAIGTDYNILMIARLREEAREGNDPRTAAHLAVEHGGPSVGSAGLILAGTFASMMLAGIAFLSEMGFAVSVGIVLSAFVMAMFLVPSLTALLGHKAWWPGHGDEPDHGGAAADRPREPVTVTTS
jgi:RND superfamily putative drug exporter